MLESTKYIISRKTILFTLSNMKSFSRFVTYYMKLWYTQWCENATFTCTRNVCDANQRTTQLGSNMQIPPLASQIICNGRKQFYENWSSRCPSHENHLCSNPRLRWHGVYYGYLELVIMMRLDMMTYEQKWFTIGLAYDHTFPLMAMCHYEDLDRSAGSRHKI